jgi:hypothetical protein
VFLCSPLLASHLTWFFPWLFLLRSRPQLLTAAARGGLKPAPASRGSEGPTLIDKAVTHYRPFRPFVLVAHDRRRIEPQSCPLERLSPASLNPQVENVMQIHVGRIYEADFRGFSHGFRPGRNEHQALDALNRRTPPNPWDARCPLCVGRVLDCATFSFVCRLPSAASIKGSPLCSAASQVLCSSQTPPSRMRPHCGFAPSRTGLSVRQTLWRSPGSRACCFSTC